MSTAAIAQPTVMTDKQLDSQVAGLNVVTPSGNNIWTVTSLSPLEGFNNGGKGNTDRTAPGLLKAVGAGALGAQ
jgi:hypothetical protein